MPALALLCRIVMPTRTERARREVLDATVSLIAEVGVERLAIDEVAARSGVAKSTIYRHWPSRQFLVIEAVHGCMAPAVTPNTGDLRADLITCYQGMIRTGLEGQMGQIMASVLDAAQRDPDLDRLLRRYLHERRNPVRTVLQLAQARGELPSDLDIEVITTVLHGPFVYRKLVERQPVSRSFVTTVVDTVLDGLRVVRPLPV
jgi:AcrR family transcriptional regulator